MKSFDELSAAWSAAAPPPRGRGTVRSICQRLGGGRHALSESAELSVEEGLVGDRWSKSRDPERLSQVTLMSAVAAAALAHGQTPGHAAGDNLYVDLDLSEPALPVGARLRIGSAVLEVTDKPHLGCKKFNERFGAGALRWVNLADHRALRLRGVNLRVLETGQVRIGDPVVVLEERALAEPGAATSSAAR
jgi:MOSC domain-containing protein YiiM